MLNSYIAPNELNPMRFNILLVEDERDIADPIVQVLADEGYHVSFAADGSQAIERLNHGNFDLVITDVRMPHVDGRKLFRWMQNKVPQTPVIMMTAYGTIPDAVDAMHNNAAHYLCKPFSMDELLDVVQKVSEQRTVDNYQEKSTHIVGTSPAMLTLKQRIDAIADSDVSVMIQGESGTGKELVARAIHAESNRRDKPFVAINCAAFPETLFEAELFGYERGAFTGATQRREGWFRAANGGTLFLDEVFEMSPTAQTKLLRVLQEGIIQPLGTQTAIKIDVRIISATNANLRGCIENGLFREDLFYRLKVFDLRLPALRERLMDLPQLVGHFIHKHASHCDTKPKLLMRAWSALRKHTFPGNVRELEHIIQHALVLSRYNDIDLEHLPDDLRGPIVTLPDDSKSAQSLSEAVRAYEREVIVHALEEHQWSRTKTAQALGISRKNLWEKANQYGIQSSTKKSSN